MASSVLDFFDATERAQLGGRAGIPATMLSMAESGESDGPAVADFDLVMAGKGFPVPGLFGAITGVN